jgi:hypothetical protein
MITFQFLNVDELYLRMCIDFKTDGQDCGQDKKFCRGTLHGHSKEGWRLISFTGSQIRIASGIA